MSELRVTASRVGGDKGDHRFVITEVPDICPQCHFHVHPQFLLASYDTKNSLVRVVYRCTRLECQSLFIGTYADTHVAQNGYYKTIFISSAPGKAKSNSFPALIVELSPMFAAIYDQCMDAESRQLDQLYGIGLRKALEFLVKDYAIHNVPETREQVLGMALAACIDSYIEDPNVKKCAKLAAWLGNDEAHYLRKWEEKDVKDLHALIQLTVNWIHNKLLTDQYVEDMLPKKQ